MPGRIVRIVRKRITKALQVEIEFSRLGEALDLGPSRRFVRRVRRRMISGGRQGLKGLQTGLGQALDSTLELVSLDSPRRIVKGVHRRAKVVLKANLDLPVLQRGLAHAVDETIEQIPLATPKGIARIMRRRAARFLRKEISLSELQRGLGRTLDHTLDLMPLDGDLLVKQGAERTKYLNRQLAWSLAFVAGAVNAGGFLAVQSYTSHVTGAVSRMADELALGHKALAMAAFGVVAFFIFGSFSSGLLISLGKRRRFRAPYAGSLMIEAALLLVFGLLGYRLNDLHRLFVPLTVALLSFIMGMHNSLVTSISNAEVRTTHMTGIATDFGLELSRLFYFNVDDDERTGRVLGNRDKLKLHGLILAAFFGGGVAGALGFKHVGFKVTIPLAALLFLLAWRPVLRDLRVRFRLIRG